MPEQALTLQARKVFIPFVRGRLKNWISSPLPFILLNFIFHAVFKQQALAFPVTVITHLRKHTVKKDTGVCVSAWGKCPPHQTSRALGTSYWMNTTEAVRVDKTLYSAAIFF